MERRLILRGMLIGALAGLLAAVFTRIFVEPQVEAAINYESGRDAAQSALDAAAGLSTHEHEAELFSRTIQADLGMGVGMILFGVAMGALFAVVFTVSVGRVGKLRPRTLALLLAGAGLLGIYLVPFLKYPANPPAVGDHDTIVNRGSMYLIMVAGSVAILLVAVRLGRQLAPRLGNWNASLVAGGTFILVIGVVMAILPSFGHGGHATETPFALRDTDGTIVYDGFPADVLSAFRMYTVGAQILLWAAIGLLFGPLAERLLTPGRIATVDRTPVGV
ncbi:CbtA family protein [Streptomyces sp. NPDC002156]